MTDNKLRVVTATQETEEEPWYKDGLRFGCTGCGQCCTGSPGYVWVTEDEIINLAAFLNLTVHEFSSRYVRVVDGRYSLREDHKTYDCLFLKEKKCTVYEHRPKQCKTYPWWVQNLQSKKAWEEAGQWCEGINHKDAALVPFQVIQQSR